MTFHPCAEPMMELFQGRSDAHGYWMPDGLIHKASKPLSLHLFDCHIRGTYGIGIYPAQLNNTCWWGCVDIDTDDIITAVNIQTALATRDITAWTERTRRGWHVWVFTAEPCPLATMRRALMATCQVIGYNPKEINPKQELLTVDRPYGNWVRLPYFGGDNATERIVVAVSRQTGEITPLSLNQFLTDALAARTHVSALDTLATRWTPPPEMRVDVTDTISDIEPLLRRLDNISFVIWRDGPLPGSDRSSTLVRLCSRLYDLGLTNTEMFAVLKAADRTWGKYHMRPDCDERLTDIIEKVTSWHLSHKP